MSVWLRVLGNLTLSASLVLVAVVIVRTLCDRLPKRYLSFLWLPVFARAVCPVSFSSGFSLFRLFSSLPGFQAEGNTMTFTLAGYQSARLRAVLEHTGLSGVLSGDGASGTSAVAAIAGGGVLKLELLLFCLWIGGTFLLLLFGFAAWLQLRRRTMLAVQAEAGVYESDQIGSAFLFGFFRPRIYLPTGLSKEERDLVLEHEKTHKRRQDSRVKLLAWMICVIHWFNPFLWLAFVMLTRDMEMACDEQVLERLGTGEKKKYSAFLLKLSSRGSALTGIPVAFGENSVKSRIKNILGYKKTRAGIAVAAAVLVACVAWLCLSNPAENTGDEVIGGADGPTSIFLAGKLGDGAESSREGENLNLSGEEKQIFEVVETFASASADRDADTVWELLSPALQSRDDLEIEILEDGTKTMGVSSPFPADDPRISVSFENGSAKAEITYPSMTSDPLWWSWKDYIILEKNGDIYQVTDWETRYFDEITGYADFWDAYSMWQPDYLEPTDVTSDTDSSFAAYLVRNDVSEAYPSYYGEKFSSPVKALETTLHVSGGVGITENADGSDVWVSYQFRDGSIRVRMTQPGLTQGSRIWVPAEIVLP